MRQCQKLSKRQRELTPPRLALALVEKVRAITGAYTVAALWCRRDSPYRDIDGVEVYDVRRDAWTYQGPHPVVCHPPCGPWGKLAWNCRTDPRDGELAMHLAHHYGGVVEQPVGSRLFREHGVGFLGWTETLLQCHWGHQCMKPTLLYWVREGWLCSTSTSD